MSDPGQRNLASNLLAAARMRSLQAGAACLLTHRVLLTGCKVHQPMRNSQANLQPGTQRPGQRGRARASLLARS